MADKAGNNNQAESLKAILAPDETGKISAGGIISYIKINAGLAAAYMNGDPLVYFRNKYSTRDSKDGLLEIARGLNLRLDRDTIDKALQQLDQEITASSAAATTPGPATRHYPAPPTEYLKVPSYTPPQAQAASAPKR